MGDTNAVVLTGGDADINIQITIAPESKANEYLVLALPTDFKNGDFITLAFQVNYEMTDGVTVLGQESSFDSTDASYFYSHTFQVTADSDVVL